MPKRLHNALNPKTVVSLAAPGTYADGNGLALKIDPKGNRRWIWRGTVEGKAAMRGLGSYPAVSLAEARKAAAATTQTVSEWAPEPEQEPVPTFWEAARRLIESRRPTWGNPKHAAQWKSTFETYAYPAIGNIPVDEIEPSDVLAVLEPIWTVKYETATRVKQRIGAVMDWAVQHGYRLYNPVGKGLLTALPSFRREEAHFPALPYERVGRAVGLVRESTANLLTKLAFEFLVLTAARSGEVRNANWGEILWERQSWEIPAIKMKSRRVHRVPLSDRTMEILTEAWQISGPDGLLFPTVPNGKAMSDMTLTAIMRRLDVPAVPHGFRSSFTDWADEQWPEYWEAADKALAHEEKNKTRRAYRRTDLFKQRIGLMQNWADYVAETADSHDLKGIDECSLTQRRSNDRDDSVIGEVITIVASRVPEAT